MSVSGESLSLVGSEGMSVEASEDGDVSVFAGGDVSVNASGAMKMATEESMSLSGGGQRVCQRRREAVFQRGRDRHLCPEVSIEGIHKFAGAEATDAMGNGGAVSVEGGVSVGGEGGSLKLSAAPAIPSRAAV